MFIVQLYKSDSHNSYAVQNLYVYCVYILLYTRHYRSRLMIRIDTGRPAEVIVYTLLSPVNAAVVMRSVAFVCLYVFVFMCLSVLFMLWRLKALT